MSWAEATWDDVVCPACGAILEQQQAPVHGNWRGWGIEVHGWVHSPAEYGPDGELYADAGYSVACRCTMEWEREVPPLTVRQLVEAGASPDWNSVDLAAWTAMVVRLCGGNDGQ